MTLSFCFGSGDSERSQEIRTQADDADTKTQREKTEKTHNRTHQEADRSDSLQFCSG